MKLDFYLQLDKNNKQLNMDCAKGLNNMFLSAMTQQPFESEYMDTIKIKVEIPDRYFNTNIVATIPSETEEIK